MAPLAPKVTDAGTDSMSSQCKSYTFEGVTFEVTRGDYDALMGRVVAAIRDAIPYAANDEQRAMLQHYAASFDLGSFSPTRGAPLGFPTSSRW